MPGISILDSGTDSAYPRTPRVNRLSTISAPGSPAVPAWVHSAAYRGLERRKLPLPEASGHTPLPLSRCSPSLPPFKLRLSGWHRQRRGALWAPPHHRPEKPPRQVTLRQQQPVVACVLEQPAARLHQSLLQAGQRPVADPQRQHRAQRAPPATGSPGGRRSGSAIAAPRWAGTDGNSIASSSPRACLP